MQKICSTCGGKLDDYVYVFRPGRAQEIAEGIREEFPNVEFTLSTIEGEKVKIIMRQFLTEVQKTKMDNYFDDKGYIEDIEAENMEK